MIGLEGVRARRVLDPRLLLAALLIVVGVVAVVVDRPQGNADIDPIDPTAVANPPTVTADALPTVQIDGVVWSQAIIGNTVYAGGRFAKARPAGSPLGSNEVARPNLLAYDITTGNLITSFAPTLNGEVRAVVASADGSTLFVGGVFTQVDGQTRSRVAALDAKTGALLPFAPPISSTVTSLAFSGNRLYVGGDLDRTLAVGALDDSGAPAGLELDDLKHRHLFALRGADLHFLKACQGAAVVLGKTHHDLHLVASALEALDFVAVERIPHLCGDIAEPEAHRAAGGCEFPEAELVLARAV
jgi:hypothetical protein